MQESCYLNNALLSLSLDLKRMLATDLPVDKVTDLAQYEMLNNIDPAPRRTQLTLYLHVESLWEASGRVTRSVNLVQQALTSWLFASICWPTAAGSLLPRWSFSISDVPFAIVLFPSQSPSSLRTDSIIRRLFRRQ